MKKFRRSDLPLREKIVAIFREQGVTVVAVLTVIGAVIAAIVEGLKPAAYLR